MADPLSARRAIMWITALVAGASMIGIGLEMHGYLDSAWFWPLFVIYFVASVVNSAVVIFREIANG